MIDTHSHIVFEVDDGSKSINQSVEMLKEAYNAGFRKIILTPHYMENYYEADKKEIKEKIEILKDELKKINCRLEIMQGNEIYITENITELLNNQKASTLNNTQYVLFELPLSAEALNLNEVIYQILETRRVPVLAHPERYKFVQKNPNKLIDLIENGVLMQSNYGSIIGEYGKDAEKTVKKMLSHNMVHMLGSDVHRQNTIYPKIREAKKQISSIVGEDKLEEITDLLPEKIIIGEKIEIEEPIPIKENILSKIFH